MYFVNFSFLKVTRERGRKLFPQFEKLDLDTHAQLKWDTVFDLLLSGRAQHIGLLLFGRAQHIGLSAIFVWIF